MQVESAGDSNSTSSAGAMGLMQVMPQTYAMLRARLGLGANPYDPRDNIMAGAAYLREMHDRYGSAGFLAAYNAGPGRFEEFRAGVRPLPAETVQYLARLNPMLGIEGRTTLVGETPEATRTPEASPIFVILTPPSAATGLRSGAQQNMQLAVADIPAEMRTRSLFAARTTAAFPSRPPAETAPQSPSDAPSNTMFHSATCVPGSTMTSRGSHGERWRIPECSVALLSCIWVGAAMDGEWWRKLGRAGRQDKSRDVRICRSWALAL